MWSISYYFGMALVIVESTDICKYLPTLEEFKDILSGLKKDKMTMGENIDIKDKKDLRSKSNLSFMNNNENDDAVSTGENDFPEEGTVNPLKRPLPRDFDSSSNGSTSDGSVSSAPRPERSLKNKKKISPKIEIKI